MRHIVTVTAVSHSRYTRCAIQNDVGPILYLLYLTYKQHANRHTDHKTCAGIECIYALHKMRSKMFKRVFLKGEMFAVNYILHIHKYISAKIVGNNYGTRKLCHKSPVWRRSDFPTESKWTFEENDETLFTAVVQNDNHVLGFILPHLSIRSVTNSTLALRRDSVGLYCFAPCYLTVLVTIWSFCLIINLIWFDFSKDFCLKTYYCDSFTYFYKLHRMY